MKKWSELTEKVNSVFTNLQLNARATVKSIAEETNIERHLVGEIVQKLKEKHIITGYTTMVDAAFIEYKTAFIHVKLSSNARSSLDSFQATVSKLGNVHDFFEVEGDFDFLIKVVFADDEELHNISEPLRKLLNVEKLITVRARPIELPSHPTLAISEAIVSQLFEDMQTSTSA
ncbi:MAG: Lrp/AsnC family transcriptional regulator [Anaerolineae bacterium]